MILLSFDIEEFDVPREHGVDISMDEQVEISTVGTHRILNILKEHGGVKATFFTTANFAVRSSQVVQRIIDEGHELASHGYNHWTFEVSDLERSKDKLEKLFSVEIKGYRQARMQPVSESEVRLAGYRYNSSLNPTFIPGRYMRLTTPRTYFMREGVLQIPASVTPVIRFPLFWLSMHNLPYSLYMMLCRWTLRTDGYLTTYFHPWEFTDLQARPDLKLPYIIRKNSGQVLVKRLGRFIDYFRSKGEVFNTYSALLK